MEFIVEDKNKGRGRAFTVRFATQVEDIVILREKAQSLRLKKSSKTHVNKL